MMNPEVKCGSSKMIGLLLFRQIHTYAFSFCMIFDPATGFRIHYSASKAMGQFALTRASTKELAA